MKNFSGIAFLTSLHDRTFRVFAKILVPGLILATATASATDAAEPIAAKYHNDLGIGDDPLKWFAYHEARNRTSHIYNKSIAQDVFAVVEDFLVDVRKFLGALEVRND